MKPKQKQKKINFKKIIAFTLITVIGISVFLFNFPKPVYAYSSSFTYYSDRGTGQRGALVGDQEGEVYNLIIYESGDEGYTQFMNEEGEDYHEWIIWVENSDKTGGELFNPEDFALGTPTANITINGYTDVEPPEDMLMITIGGAVRFVNSSLGNAINDGRQFELNDDPENILNVDDLEILASPNTADIYGQMPIHVGPNGGYSFLVAPQTRTLTVYIDHDFTYPGERWVTYHLHAFGSVQVEIQSDNAGGHISAELIEISVERESPDLYKALEVVTGWINNILAGLFNSFKDLAKGLLIIGNIMEQGHTVSETWDTVRVICNSLFIIGLLIIAFANVFQLQIDYYAIKAILPRFIGAIVLVNFSLLICKLMIDFSNVLIIRLIGDPDTVFGKIFSSNIMDPSFLKGISDIGFWFFALIIIFALILGVIVLTILLVARIVMIWFLVILAPVAFLLMVLPFTRGVYSTWWKWFAKYVFMGPVVALMLFIAGEASSSGTNLGAGGTVGDEGVKIAVHQIIRTLFIASALFAAGIIPFVLGDKVMASVHNATKKVGKWGVKAGSVTPQGRKISAMWGGHGKRAEAKAERKIAAGAFGWREKFGQMRPEALEGLSKRGQELKAKHGLEGMHNMMSSRPKTAEQRYRKASARLSLAESGETGLGKNWLPKKKDYGRYSNAERDVLLKKNFTEQDTAAMIKEGNFHMVSGAETRVGLYRSSAHSPDKVKTITAEAINTEESSVVRKSFSAEGIKNIMTHGSDKQQEAVLKRYNDLSTQAKNQIINMNRANQIPAEARAAAKDAKITIPNKTIPHTDADITKENNQHLNP